MYFKFFCFFFFSSRRRHTRLQGDWSSDVCSSDLTRGGSGIRQLIDIQPPSERAFLVGAPRKGSADAVQVEDHLDELYRLADTAGAEGGGGAEQRGQAPDPQLYLGEREGEGVKRRGIGKDT